MKYLLLILILLTSINAKADYNPLPIPKLLDFSRLIVTAKIIKINDTSFEAQITKVHKGNWDIQYPIKINKFENWTCAQVRADYMIGQTAIYFLGYNVASKSFYALSAGNEGEMAIFEGRVYQKKYAYNLEPFKEGYGQFDTPHGKISGFQYSLNEVEKGIQKYFEKEDDLKEQLQDRSILDLVEDENKFYRRIIIDLIYSNRKLFGLLQKKMLGKQK